MGSTPAVKHDCGDRYPSHANAEWQFVCPVCFKKPIAHSYCGINIKQGLLKEQSATCLASVLKTVSVIRDKKHLRNCCSQGEPRETWQLRECWHPGTEKRNKNLKKRPHFLITSSAFPPVQSCSIVCLGILPLDCSCFMSNSLICVCESGVGLHFQYW